MSQLQRAAGLDRVRFDAGVGIWRQPCAKPVLAERSIHVWRFSLESSGSLDELRGCLDQDELARAARFATSTLSRQYIVAHARVRGILGLYTGIAPDALKFRTGPFGKPRISEEMAAGCEFNLGHSGGIGLLAVTRRLPVGVDLERIRGDLDIAALAASVLGADELATLAAAPLDERDGLFFRFWVRKEAALKALGSGLSVCPTRCEVSLEHAVARIRAAGPNRECGHWYLCDIPVGAGLVAAVASRWAAPDIELWDDPLVRT